MTGSRTLFLCAAVVALGCTKDRQPALIDRVVRRLKADHPDFPLQRVDERTLEVNVGPGDASMTLSLDNLTLRCRNQPESCDESIAAISRSLGEQVKALREPERPQDVLLTLHDASWLHNVEQAMTKVPADARAESALLTEPLVADLHVVYVIDRPNGMAMLNRGHAQKMQLGPRDVPVLARKNLLALAPHIQWMKMEDGMWTNARGDNYDSAYLAIPDSFRSLADEHGGRLIVGVPSRNRVFVISDPAKLPALKEAVDRAFKEDDHALTRALLDWTPDGSRVHATP